MTALDTTEKEECVAHTSESWGLYLFTVDHDRYWQSCDAEEERLMAQDQAGAGASLGSGSHSAVSRPGSPVSVGAHKCTQWSPGHTGDTGDMSSQFGLPSLIWHDVSSKTSERIKDGTLICEMRWWHPKYSGVSTQCVIQINCECEIQLFDLTTVIINRQPTRLSESLISKSGSWPDSRQHWVDGGYFLDCPNLHLRTLLIRGFLLQPWPWTGYSQGVCDICVQRLERCKYWMLDDAVPSCHLLTSSVSCQGRTGALYFEPIKHFPFYKICAEYEEKT